MNYIVVDFEWNQSPDGRASNNKCVPFEILEIGAVKLDGNFGQTDSFHGIVKPVLYREFHSHTRTLLKLDMNTIKKEGRPFKSVADEFFKWCGDDYRFCTWGCMDLTILQQNLDYFGLIYMMPPPVFYYDVQKLYAIYNGDRKARRSLEKAIEEMGLDKGEDFHRALADAHYTARIFARVQNGNLLKNSSVDYYQHPESRKEELHLRYPGYAKYVSRLFDTREEGMSDRNVLDTKCYMCSSSTNKVQDWFSYKGNTHYCVIECPKHGLICGKIRIRKTVDDRYFIIKTFRREGAASCNEILRKKEAVRQKRMQKRHWRI